MSISTMMLSRAHARRGAINLNNCGVILLSRHQWHDAMDTFKDALRLMKSAANEQGGGADAVSEHEMQSALQQAWYRTAKALPASSTQEEANQGPVLKVISSEFNPATVCALLQSSNGCLQDTNFLVTIEPIDFEGWDADVIDLESACILYNLGIAKVLLSFASGCDCYTRTKLQDSSYRMLQMTHTLAFKLFRNALSKSHLCYPVMLINILLMIKLVSCSTTERTSEQYCQSLEELVFLVHAHQTLVPVVDHKFAPAA